MAHRSPAPPSGPPLRPRPREARRRYARRRAGVVVVAILIVAAAATGLDRLVASDGHERAADAATSARDPIDASQFAPGACQLERPTSGDNHKVVFIDAGHGGIDPGGVGETASGATINEAEESLPIELDAANQLRAKGYTVAVSRTGNTTVTRLTNADVDGNDLTLVGSHDDVLARDECANEAGADLLVGIYFDAGASSDEAGSVTGYDADRPFSADNLRFADLLQHDVLGALNAQGDGIPDEGVLPDSGLGSLVSTSATTGLAAEAATYDHLLELGPADAGYQPDPATMPGAVIEPLYLTDPFEGSLANSSAGQHAIATGVAQSVEQYFAPAPAPAATTTSSTT